MMEVLTLKYDNDLNRSSVYTYNRLADGKNDR